MAISRTQTFGVATKADGAGSSVTYTFASVPTAGNLLVACLATGDNGGAAVISSFNDNIGDGVGWTPSSLNPQILNGSNAYRIYYKVVGTPSGGGKAITCAITGTQAVILFAGEYGGGAVNWAVDGTPVTATGTTGSPSAGSITTTVADAVLIGFETTDGSLSPAGANYTRQATSTTWAADAVEDQLVTATGTYAVDWGTSAFTLWRALGIAFSATPSGPAVTTPPIYGQLGYGPLGSGPVGMAWAGAKVPAGGAYTLTAATGSYTLTGVAAAIQRSRIVPAAAGSYALTGVAALIKRSRLLTATAGSYTLTGVAASILRNKVLPAAAGAYTLTGNIALLLRNKIISAAAGSYNLTGQAATITYTPLTGGYTLVANAGAYTLSGQAATITRSRVLPAAAGSYALTGQAATILRNKVLPAAAGSYALTGQAATILKSKVLPAAAGSYTLTGQPATLLRNRVLPAAAGSYALTGKAANIVYTPLAGAYTLVAASGSYTLTGQPATITYSGGTPATGEGDNWRRRRRPAAHVRG